MKKLFVTLMILASVAGVGGAAAFAASGCCPGACCTAGADCCK